MNSVVPAEEVVPAAVELAQRLAEVPARALQDTKRLLNTHVTRVLTGLLDQALHAERASVNSAEHAELTQRLIEKTRP